MNATASKRTRLVAAALAAAALACAIMTGCADNRPGDAYEAVAGTETTPALMPASHEKYLNKAVYKCYYCHGASDRGNPSVSSAVAMPTGHYVDNDPSTRELAPERNQCRTCHSVDYGKVYDDAKILEQAEIETGQDAYDDEDAEEAVDEADAENADAEAEEADAEAAK